MAIQLMRNDSCSVEPSWFLVNIPREEQKSDVPKVDNYYHRWFFFTLKLQIAPDISAIHEINLTKPAYIETIAKVGGIKGKTLIIVNSPHIGVVEADRVILCRSRAKSVKADTVCLYASIVRRRVVANTITTWPLSQDVISTGSSPEDLKKRKHPEMILQVIERSKVFS